MSTIIDKIRFRIKLFIDKFKLVPDIKEKREIIDQYRRLFNYNGLIETGTFFGDTVEYFKTRFQWVKSIELSGDLAQRAKSRFSNDKNIEVIEGDSSVVLAPLLAKIKEPVLFWLDGHYSSEFFIKDEFIRTAKGETNTPILKELDIILSAPIESVILIDDARLFTGNDDYPSIKEIKAKVRSYKADQKVFVKKDIIHIIPARK